MQFKQLVLVVERLQVIAVVNLKIGPDGAELASYLYS